MKYFELICTAFIKEDIEFVNSFDVILEPKHMMY